MLLEIGEDHKFIIRVILHDNKCSLSNLRFETTFANIQLFTVWVVNEALLAFLRIEFLIFRWSFFDLFG